jgi:hypothetical protein
LTPEDALERILGFRQRIERLAATQPNDFRAQWRIIENDIGEFHKEAFQEESVDYKKLHAVLYPMAISVGTDPWRNVLADARYMLDTLQLIEHRLANGQSGLKHSPGDEIVIEPGSPHSAYVKLREIVRTARTILRIVDPYVGSDLYSLLSNATPGVEVQILTWKSKAPPDFIAEGAKFSSEYGIQIEIRWGTGDFHDRFLLADDNLYMSGGSFKDLGKKLSYVTEVESTRDILGAELDKRWSSGTPA